MGIRSLRRLREASAVNALIERIPEGPRSAVASVIRGDATESARARVRAAIAGGHGAGGASPAEFVLHGSTLRPLTARVVHTLDLHAESAATFALIAEALTAAGIEFVAAPSRPRTIRQIAITSADAPGAARAIAEVTSGSEWHLFKLSDGGGRHTPHPSRLEGLTSGLNGQGVRVFRYLADSEGTVLTSPALGVEVQAWAGVPASAPRPDDGTYPAGTLVPPTANPFAMFLTPRVWAEANAHPSNVPAALRHPGIFELTEPVDVVYTWVDASDPRWQERKRAREQEMGHVHPAALDEARFRSVDELRYSMRSIATYANWVRTIHIVTDQQVPHWLDVNHPKIRVVDHRDLFGAGHPGVFNSHAIESRLHHVPDLAEHYLYLNDDVFFGRRAFGEDFFQGNGLAKIFPSDLVLDPDLVDSGDPPIMAAAKNGRDVIERTFGRAVNQKFRHGVHPQLRSVLEHLEAAEPDLFAQVARTPFRSPQDISVASSLHHWYAYALGRAVPAGLTYLYLDIHSPQAARTLEALASTRRYDTFCLNQERSNSADGGAALEKLSWFLRSYFPLAAPWEHEGT